MSAQFQRPVWCVVGLNLADNSGDLTADGLNPAGANLKVPSIAPGQNQVTTRICERLRQSEADPLTGAGHDAAVAAQVEKVPGNVGDWERHGFRSSLSAGTDKVDHRNRASYCATIIRKRLQRSTWGIDTY